MFKKLIDVFIHWCYADKTKDYFTNNNNYICKTNLYFLKNISKMFLLMLCAFIIPTVISGSNLKRVLPYILFIISNLITYIISLKFEKNLLPIKHLNVVLAANLCAILIFSIWIGIFINPDMLAAFTLTSILGGQLAFVLPPLYTSGIVFIGCIFFSILTFLVKSTSIAILDTFNAFTTFLIGAVLSWYMLKIRIRDSLHHKEILRINEQLKTLSSTDELTGLTNRRVFNSSYETIFEKCKNENKTLSVLMMDIDFFKLYNDNYGHLLGDECIKKISSVFINSSNDANKSIYRLGGEEFIAIISDSTYEESLEYANKLCTSIRNLKIPHDHSPIDKFATISIGFFHSIVAKEFNCNDFIKSADDALYRAKNSGRNRVSI